MTETKPRFGSDIIAEMLRRCDIRYAAMNPGATYRGLHDSIVNYLGNENPELILCNHEEIAVAMAHGYAKSAGKPMAALVHNIVGLQHASMAMFNAWSERVPMMVLGGTGPVDTSRRRPWIDWVHTANVQGTQVRDYVKLDDQPSGPHAIAPSFLRAYRMTCEQPQGPVYICYDADLQEMALTEDIPLPPVDKHIRVSRLAPSPDAVEQLAAAIVEAEYPVFVAGTSGRDVETMAHLVALAEATGAAVIDAGKRHNFPSTHPQDVTWHKADVLARADLVVGFEVFDLFGALRTRPNKQTRESESLLKASCKVAHITLGDLHAHSWVHDFQETVGLDWHVMADTAVATPLLLAEVQKRLARQSSAQSVIEARRQSLARRHQAMVDEAQKTLEQRWDERPISYPRLAYEVWQAIKAYDWQLANGWVLGWTRRLWDFDKPDAWLGDSEGGGLGYGMGVSLGASLAHRDDDRLIVNLQSEGDFLFTPSALYTAAHHRLPLLTIMTDNHTYYNDEEHQEEVALARGRDVERKTIGIRIEDPEVDFATLAKSYGVYGEGRIEDPDQLGPALRRVVKMCVEDRRPALLDVHCQPR